MSVFTIRAEQMKVFEERLLRDWLRDYLASCYPQKTAEIGPAGLNGLIERAVVDGRARGIRDARDLRKYLHFVFLVDGRRETDEELVWARKILDNPRFTSMASRLRVLEDETIRRLSTRSGAKR